MCAGLNSPCPCLIRRMTFRSPAAVTVMLEDNEAFFQLVTDFKKHIFSFSFLLPLTGM